VVNACESAYELAGSAVLLSSVGKRLGISPVESVVSVSPEQADQRRAVAHILQVLR
jgi:hypothetical protein